MAGGHKDGMLASYTINCYDPVDNNFLYPPISTPCCWFSMTILNKKLLISGGHDRRRETTRQVLKLDASQLKMYSKMITARSWVTAASYHRMRYNRGVNSKNKVLSSSELLDDSNGL